MLMLLSVEAQSATGVYRFRLNLPSRPTWGSVTAVSGHPATQVLSRFCDWRPGLPIPEGDYLMGPLDVAGWTSYGKPDWEASFGGEGTGSMCRDLIPTRANAHSGLRYALRTHPGSRRVILSSDVYLQSAEDWERFYDWSTRGPIDMLSVSYGLVPGREPRRVQPPALSRLKLLNQLF
jgi:hypothetical protein